MIVFLYDNKYLKIKYKGKVIKYRMDKGNTDNGYNIR